MDDASRERCQRISDLSYEARSFLPLSTVDFLTRVSLIPASVVVELVDAPLEAGMTLWSAVSVFIL